MDRSHCAKYMILLGPDEAPRALLFNGEHRYLSEVFDDELVLDQLLKSSQVCPPPRDLSLVDVMPPPPSGTTHAMRCFALG